MTSDGKTYPLIGFDQIIDTDFGLLQLINDKYNDRKTFYWSLVESPAKYKIGLLYNRKEINPLAVIAKERENTELLDDYYNQFIENEYIEILKRSIPTELYKALQYFIGTEGVFPAICCKNQVEITYLKKLNPDICNKCVIVEKDYKDMLKSRKYSPIYIKNINLISDYIDLIEADTIFIAGYRFNFEDDERKEILKKYQILLSSNNIRVYDAYTKEDIIEGV